LISSEEMLNGQIEGPVLDFSIEERERETPLKTTRKLPPGREMLGALEIFFQRDLERLETASTGNGVLRSESGDSLRVNSIDWSPMKHEKAIEEDGAVCGARNSLKVAVHRLIDARVTLQTAC
jgi:hypothetical protein